MTIKAGEILFLDTNILLIATDESRTHHARAKRLLASASSWGIQLGVSGQICREYLVVATREPKVNGLGLSPENALKNLDEIRKRTAFYEETETTADFLQQMAARHRLVGKRIHDANVVATMLTHNLNRLVTENPADFKLFPQIRTLGLVDELQPL